MTSTPPTLLYGGTFDPPHAAHAALPLLVAEQLQAQTLLYIPAGRSPFKTNHPQSPPHHRLAMLELLLQAIQPHTHLHLDIDRGEIQRGDQTPSYTIDTVRRLTQQLGPDTPLRLLLGTDQFFAFDQWRDAQELARLAPPVVMVRPPHGQPQTQRFLQQQAPDYLQATTLVDIPEMDVASSTIRKAMQNHQDVSAWLIPAIQKYAEQHRLYAAD